jgi:hypothetical protein
MQPIWSGASAAPSRGGAANEPNNRSGGSSPQDGQCADEDYGPVIVDGMEAWEEQRGRGGASTPPRKASNLVDLFSAVPWRRSDRWGVLAGRSDSLASFRSDGELLVRPPGPPFPATKQALRRLLRQRARVLGASLVAKLRNQLLDLRGIALLVGRACAMVVSLAGSRQRLQEGQVNGERSDCRSVLSSSRQR